MNYHLSPISFKRYSLTLVYAFFFMAAFEWGMEIYFEKLYGDLTRIGNFSEHDFGWRVQQPSVIPAEYLKDYPDLIIPVEHFKDHPLTEADILVIGDSFSIGHVWQTKLVADGLKVSTMHWKELNQPEVLRSDLGDALRKVGFKGRYIVIESVERFFQSRMRYFSKGRNQIVKSNIMASSSLQLYPFPQRERLSLSRLNGADWGIKALSNKIKLSLLSEKYLKSGEVQAINFDGCQLFSHRLCNYAIFLNGDFEKETFSSIINVLTVNKNLQSVGIQPIWLIIPDKSTVYLGYGKLNKHPYQNIWQQFAQYPELITPNLGKLFIQKSRTVKDFYMPNDTHLSTDGFLYLGEIVRKKLLELKN